MARISCSLNRSFEYSHGPIARILLTDGSSPLEALNSGMAIDPGASFERGPRVMTGGSERKEGPEMAAGKGIATSESSESLDETELDDDDRLWPLARKYLSSFFMTGTDGVAVG